MIRLNRPACPTSLKRKGPALTKANHEAYSTYPTPYQNGALKFDFKKTVYGNKEVKECLIGNQHNKCCFCEGKVTSSYGDVEHYRPKSEIKQSEKEPIIRPGYYWLAYDWDNLLYACDICNRTYKKTYFPLTDASKRAKSPTDNLDDEQPLIINPYTENPEDYIDYRGTVPIAKNANAKGAETIKRTGIADTERKSFNEDRRSYLLNVKRLFMALSQGTYPDQVRTELEKALQEYQQAKSEYSLMIKCAVRDKFQFL